MIPKEVFKQSSAPMVVQRKWMSCSSSCASSASCMIRELHNHQAPLHQVGLLSSNRTLLNSPHAAHVYNARTQHVNARRGWSKPPIYSPGVVWETSASSFTEDVEEQDIREKRERNFTRRPHMEHEVASGSPVLEAAAQGWSSVVKAFLDAAGPGGQELERVVNGKGDRDHTPLHHAAKGGHVETMKLLFEYGATVDPSTTCGRTPLFLAVEHGNLEACKLLLARGANPLARTIRTRRSTLHTAGGKGHEDILRLLLDQSGVPVDDLCASQWTTLHVVSSRGYTAMVDLLLDRGASIEALNTGSWTPLLIACHNHRTDIVKRLLDRGANPHFVNPKGFTPLHHAVHRADVESAKLLVSLGVDLLQKNEGGWNVLHVATQGNCPLEMSEFLVEEIKKQGGSTLLMEVLTQGTVETWRPVNLAVYFGRWDIAKLFIECGAPIQGRTPEVAREWTAMHSAVQAGNVEILGELLKLGASVNVKNAANWTPLHSALDQVDGRCADVLLDNGADPNVMTNQSMAPLHFACRKGNAASVARLLDMGAEINVLNGGAWSPLHVAVHWGHEEVVELLLTKGADATLLTSDKWSSLHISIEVESARIMWLLIQHGCPINQLSTHRRSALHIACRKGKMVALQILLEAGAEFETKDKFRFRPIDIAALGRRPDIQEWLVYYGSKPSTIVQDRNSMTAMAKKEKQRRKNQDVFHEYDVVLESQKKPAPHYTQRWEVADWLHIVLGGTQGSTSQQSKERRAQNEETRANANQADPANHSGGYGWDGKHGDDVVADQDAWLDCCQHCSELVVSSIERKRGSYSFDYFGRIRHNARRNLKGGSSNVGLIPLSMREGLAQFHKEHLEPVLFPLRDEVENLDLRLVLHLDFKDLVLDTGGEIGGKKSDPFAVQYEYLYQVVVVWKSRWATGVARPQQLHDSQGGVSADNEEPAASLSTTSRNELGNGESFAFETSATSMPNLMAKIRKSLEASIREVNATRDEERNINDTLRQSLEEGNGGGGHPSLGRRIEDAFAVQERWTR